MNIRLLNESDLAAWHDMRRKLWPDPPPEMRETELWFGKPNYVIWLAETEAGEPVGFIEAQTCNRADGCESDAILYIEGWFIEENFRKQGICSELMGTAEQWARDHGLQELASDAVIDNHISQHAHLILGFEAVGRQVTYAKKL